MVWCLGIGLPMCLYFTHINDQTAHSTGLVVHYKWFLPLMCNLCRYRSCMVTWIVEGQPWKGALQTGNLMLLLGYHTTHEHKVLLCVVINMLFQSIAISLRKYMKHYCVVCTSAAFQYHPFYYKHKIKKVWKAIT